MRSLAPRESDSIYSVSKRHMTREQVLALVQTLGLIDLREARTYLDEEGSIEAILIMRDVQENDFATSPGGFPTPSAFPNLYGDRGARAIPSVSITW